MMVMARMTNSSGLRLRLWMDSKEEGGSPIRNPSTASIDARVADGWMSGLGVPQRPSTDALGQLLSDYAKRVYTVQLQHLKVFQILLHETI